MQNTPVYDAGTVSTSDDEQLIKEVLGSGFISSAMADSKTQKKHEDIRKKRETAKQSLKQKYLYMLNDSDSKEAAISEIALKLSDEIKIIDTNPFIKIGGVWVHDTIAIANRLYQELPNLKESQEREIIHKIVVIKGKSEVIEPNTNLIYFRNGVYDLEQSKFRKESSEDTIFNKFACDYDDSAPDDCGIVDDFINHLAGNRVDEARMIWEMIAYALSPANPMQRAHLLIGAGGTGKSVLLKLIEMMIGSPNVKAVDLKGLNHDRTLAALYKKHLCIVDEAEEYVGDITGFKMVTSSGLLRTRYLYGEEFDFHFEGKLIMSTNEVPRIFDTNEAVVRRLIIIPCTGMPIAEENRIWYLEKELYKHQAYIVKKAIDVLNELIAVRKFKRSEESLRLSKEGVKINNPVIEFFEGLSCDQIEGIATHELYAAYIAWAGQNRHKPLGVPNFGKELRRVFKFDVYQKNDNGNRYRHYENVRRIKGEDPEEGEQLSISSTEKMPY